MKITLSGAARPALILLVTLALSACSMNVKPQTSTPSDTAGGMITSMNMKADMPCSCCGKMTEKGEGKDCCSDMKDGCPCCSGMSGGEGMMCQHKAKTKDMSGMDHSNMNARSTDLYAPAMKSMRENMSMAPTGNADADFMRVMIPHHQGAIDMALLVLVHGKDPQVRELAENVIRTQQSEIAFMREWLKRPGQ